MGEAMTVTYVFHKFRMFQMPIFFKIFTILIVLLSGYPPGAVRRLTWIDGAVLTSDPLAAQSCRSNGQEALEHKSGKMHNGLVKLTSTKSLDLMIECSLSLYLYAD